MKTKFILFILVFQQVIYAQDTSLSIISNIGFPLRIQIQSLENLANNSLKGVLYLDSSYANDNDDQLKCTVWKDGSIRLTSLVNNTIRLDLPLKVWIEKRVGSLGIYTQKSTEFKLTMTFLLRYSISKDWILVTHTTANGYKWSQKPELQFGALTLPITPIVEKILDRKQQSYTSLIDKQISKAIDLKKDISTVWNQVQYPRLISEEYRTWLKITPLSISSSPIHQDKNTISSNYHLKVNVETIIGDTPAMNPILSHLPMLKIVNEIQDTFHIYTCVTIPTSEINTVANKRFLGQIFFFQDSQYQMRINHLQISSLDQLLKFNTDISGSYNGMITLQGKPFFTLDNNIQLAQLEFDLKTKNIVHNVAKWLFHGKIEKAISENFKIETQSIFIQAQTNLEEALNQSFNGIQCRGKLFEFTPQSVIAKDSNIFITIKAKGKLSMEF